MSLRKSPKMKTFLKRSAKESNWSMLGVMTEANHVSKVISSQINLCKFTNINCRYKIFQKAGHKRGKAWKRIQFWRGWWCWGIWGHWQAEGRPRGHQAAPGARGQVQVTLGKGQQEAPGRDWEAEDSVCQCESRRWPSPSRYPEQHPDPGEKGVILKREARVPEWKEKVNCRHNNQQHWHHWE